MRLIDADAYADEMRKRQNQCQVIYKSAKTEDERNYWEGIFMTFVEAKLTLDNIPTVDAETVVRCKDCAFRDVLKYCSVVKQWVQDDDFYCADGKKKDGEHDG